MAKSSASPEPSMEEILASIRRIISDETPAAKAPTPAAAPAPKVAPAPVEEAPTHMSEDDLDKLFSQAGDDDDDAPMDLAEEAVDEDEAAVLELVEETPEPADEPLDLVEGLMPDEAELAFVEPARPEPRPEPPKAEAPKAEAPRRAAPPPPADDFEDPEPLVSPQTGASVHAAFGNLTHTILSANAKTLDDLVKEMLRPMLKSWLDENLPVIVERLVRAEIERVSRGR